MRAALLFPGQGTLQPGFAAPLLRSFPNLGDLLAAAGDRLGLDLLTAARRPPAEVRPTAVNQRLVLGWSVCVAAAAFANVAPIAVAGHSVGELSAVYAAGMLTSEATFDLVATRADLMERASGDGGLLAVDGLSAHDVRCVVEALEGRVVLALENTADGVVLAGAAADLEAVAGLASRRGARRVRRLVVGGAFHSPAMSVVRPAWEVALASVDLRPPICPVIRNVDGRATSDPSEVRLGLAAQLDSPVRWRACQQAVASLRPTDVFEVGGTRALATWFRREHPSTARVWSMHDAAHVRATRSRVGGEVAA